MCTHACVSVYVCSCVCVSVCLSSVSMCVCVSICIQYSMCCIAFARCNIATNPVVIETGKRDTEDGAHSTVAKQQCIIITRGH